MESKELLVSVVCLLIVITEFRVSGMSTVNTDFERYLRAINSSTTVPNVEDRIINDSFIFAFLNYSYVNGEDKYVTIEEPEEKARYGEGKVLNVKGLLVHVSGRHDFNDDKACKPDILGTRGSPLPTVDPWIALVRRGECTFEEKVKNVANKGAVGVIIFNDKPVMNLEKMQIKDKSRNITAVMTYQDVGLNMANVVDQGFLVVASITKGRSGVRPINTLNKTSVLFVSISFIVLMIISLVWLIFYYIQRFRYLQSKDQQSRHLCSVTKRAIMKIPTKTGKGNDKDGDNDCCPICIETYKSSDCIRVLPCNHEFHKNCIDPWLIEHRTCPMCKLDVLKHYGYVVGEPTAQLPISSTTNERIASVNDHVILASSNILSSHFGNTSSNNNSSNISSSYNNSRSNSVNVIAIGRTVPGAIDTNAAPNSDSRVNGSSSVDGSSSTVVASTTASRQVTDV